MEASPSRTEGNIEADSSSAIAFLLLAFDQDSPRAL